MGAAVSDDFYPEETGPPPEAHASPSPASPTVTRDLTAPHTVREPPHPSPETNVGSVHPRRDRIGAAETLRKNNARQRSSHSPLQGRFFTCHKDERILFI
ncbi:hypothetical protein GCM10022252_41900 [Streptosporangium oxazolinicum]|uniref:Uncharacterized protein n=1 Tax=Streptosporangium oxazolinicum TaxID=909287 RepID=A0ABP8B1H8_9ACTN